MVEENDATLTNIYIGNTSPSGPESIRWIKFNSRLGRDYERLGECIGNNTHITTLEIDVHDTGLHTTNVALNVAEFLGGLRQNSSIVHLHLFCEYSYDGRQAIELLNVYRENNSYMDAILCVEIKMLALSLTCLEVVQI